MTFCYMPILKWKQGELTALKEFNNDLRHCLLPILELPTIELKDGAKFRAAFAELLPNMIKKLKAAKLDQNRIGIDVSAMYHKSKATVLNHVANQLWDGDINVLPVVHPDMILYESADLAKLNDFPSVILRIPVNSIVAEQADMLIDQLSEIMGDETEMHVVLDMNNIVAGLPAAIVQEVSPYITRVLSHPKATTVTFAGGSFPMSLQGIKQGVSKLQRVEWLSYQALVKQFDQLKYGDYAVTNPVPLPEIDPKKMNPSVQIRYAHEHEWFLFKAGGIRPGGMKQYNPLAKLLVAHTVYCGSTYSYGDKNYDTYASPGASSGNPMTWRRDATSHHLVYTTKQLKAGIGL